MPRNASRAERLAALSSTEGAAFTKDLLARMHGAAHEDAPPRTRPQPRAPARVTAPATPPPPATRRRPITEVKSSSELGAPRSASSSPRSTVISAAADRRPSETSAPSRPSDTNPTIAPALQAHAELSPGTASPVGFDALSPGTSSPVASGALSPSPAGFDALSSVSGPLDGVAAGGASDGGDAKDASSTAADSLQALLSQQAPTTNPLFAAVPFSTDALSDTLLGEILSRVLEPDFPGAVWAGTLTQKRRDRLEALGFFATSGGHSDTLARFPWDGRPNGSTRSVLAARGVCRRWRDVVAARVIKHMGVFGPTHPAEDHASPPCAPELRLETLVMVARGGLPLPLASLGALSSWLTPEKKKKKRRGHARAVRHTDSATTTPGATSP